MGNENPSPHNIGSEHIVLGAVSSLLARQGRIDSESICQSSSGSTSLNT